MNIISVILYTCLKNFLMRRKLCLNLQITAKERESGLEKSLSTIPVRVGLIQHQATSEHF